MTQEAPLPSPHLETDLWRWLLFESGLSRRRAREIILQGAQSNALSLFWQAGAAILAQQLELAPDEAKRMEAARANWPQIQRKFEMERRSGVVTLRLNESGYPDTLNRFLPPERRPLLLFLRGETELLDLPMVLPVAETPPADTDWALTTLAELTTEGALALLIARAGFEARAARVFLDAHAPFVLVVPQGLAAYSPPAGLQKALDENRVLLISPFQPDWQPPHNAPNPMLPHASGFARVLAHALLALTGPAPEPASGQPCFRGPDCADCERCPDVYDGAESFFLRLAEAAAPIPPITTTTTPTPHPDLPPPSPEEILSTLTQGGKIPPALAARLKNNPQTKH